MQTVRGELVEPQTAVPCVDFDLSLTLRSGQVFRWREGLSPHSASSGQAPGTVPFFTGWISGSLVSVSQEANQLVLKGVSPKTARQFFALDADLPAITRQIDVDPIIHEAIRQYPGLRVIRQDPWECTASFMLSAFNNIPRLTGMLETLSARFGKIDEPSPLTELAISRRAIPRSGEAGRATLAIPRRGIASLGARPSLSRPPKSRWRTGTMPAPASHVPGPTSPSRGNGTAPLRRRGLGGTSRHAKAERPRFAGELPFRRERGRSLERAGHGGAGERPAVPPEPIGSEGVVPTNNFPRPEAFAAASERALRNCGLGYRAPYLKAMAWKVASGEVDLEKLRSLEDEELRRALLGLPGVGEKVAECVMLFAYGRASAFPVDVWIGRAMRKWYFRRRKVSDRKIREFARKHFGPHCGWAQQALYCFARWDHGRSSV